jgi:hypothetical protein
MNTSTLLNHMAHTYATCLRTVRKKNTDYAGNNTPDAFRTMRGVEAFQICSTEQGILSRMSEKMGRISNLVVNNQQPQVQDEPAEEALRDLIGHAAILLAYLDTKEGTSDPTKGAIGPT